ncbi:MAG: alkaline phosphatase D family protein [Litorimonas sp.]
MASNDLTRRSILSVAVASTAAACSPKTTETLTAQAALVKASFNHGVASGDPAANSVVLWTRITPQDNADLAKSVPTQPTSDMRVTWEISATDDFAVIAAAGEIVTHAARDWTVKAQPNGLSAGQIYYYRFHYNGNTSPIGQTKTLPEGDLESVRFAITSCANWQHGFFNTYDHIARQDHFDALLHLGDYYYEYGQDSADEQARGIDRLHEPSHEIITLDDYRGRHAQYRTDASLQAVSAKMPMITIWDDHEVSNDSWRGGAENHGENEGVWEDRKRAALRAYYEWMPIREPNAGSAKEAIFRHYNYGNLLSLITVETRLLARDEPLIIDDYFDIIREDNGTQSFDKILFDEKRDMLGQAQTDFIIETLKTSKATGQNWRILANQVIIGRVSSPDLTPHIDPQSLDNMANFWPGVREFVEFSQYGLPTYLDSWDGYPVARDKFYDRLSEAGINDVVVVTGDSHEFWVNDLTDKSGEPMGVELGTTSVCSKTLADYMGPGAEDYALLMTQNNKDVRYYNPMRSGYLDLELGKKTGTARLMNIDTRLSKNYKAELSAQFTVRPTSQGSVKFSAPKGLSLKQRALFSGLG